MDIHFNHTEPVDAAAETLFEVLTDYAGYPRFNAAVVKMKVVVKHENGAEFIAKRKTRIAKQVRAFDRYERPGDLIIKRTYGPGSTAQSTWTIHPVDAGHSTLTIEASTTMPLVPGLVMKPSCGGSSTASTSVYSSKRRSDAQGRQEVRQVDPGQLGPRRSGIQA